VVISVVEAIVLGPAAGVVGMTSVLVEVEVTSTEWVVVHV